MNKDFLKITYIYHDCFLIESRTCALLFDYWHNPAVDSDLCKDKLPDILCLISPEKPIYIFVSHFHKDHYNPQIFSWSRHRQNIRYIISADVRRHARHILRPDSVYKGFKPDPAIVFPLSKGGKYEDSIVDVRAFGSTDVGNSYAVCVKNCGKTVFHAGDLNCWAWRDESEPDEVASAEKAFRSELDFILRDFKEFDVAMFPVDSRVGSGYAQGAYEFVRKFCVKMFIPMHFMLADTDEQRSQRVNDALAFEKYAVDEGEYAGLTNVYDSILKFYPK